MYCMNCILHYQHQLSFHFHIEYNEKKTVNVNSISSFNNGLWVLSYRDWRWRLNEKKIKTPQQESCLYLF